MPRGPVVASPVPGAVPQNPGDVIQSSVWNATVDDIYNIFNTPQPIEYGGTGATTVVGGADALSPAFVNVASAATTNIGAASSPNVNVTGTTTITAFDIFAAAAKRLVKFTGVLTLTHNATSLILPGGTNITTAPGDFALFVSQGSGNWECVFYTSFNNGQVVDSVFYSFNTYTSITSVIPNDDTIPQIGEGNPIFSVNYTPKTITNKLRIRCEIPCSGDGIINVTAALFVAGAANAIQMDTRTISGADYFEKLVIEFEITPASISAQNIRVNCGPGSGTMYLNGIGAGRRGGGALSASLVIEEIRA